jgi:phage head maturation protease
MDTNEIIGAIDAEIQRLQAVKALLDGSPTTKPAAKPSGKSGRRKMSAAGRARIAAAQKARWAKAKAGK